VTGHYEVLGIAPDAAPSEVRQAYLALARVHHPDRSGGDPARMRAVNEAWTVLGDPERRRRYDLERGHRRHTPPGAWAGMPDAPAEAPVDLEDDRPVRVTIAVPRSLTLLPVGLFAAAIGTGIIGVFARAPALLALAMMFVVLSGLLFVASPFVALYASRRSTRGGGPTDGG
jgi:hypothetical protein